MRTISSFQGETVLELSAYVVVLQDAFRYVASSPPEVQRQIIQTFKPPREGEEERSTEFLQLAWSKSQISERPCFHFLASHVQKLHPRSPTSDCIDCIVILDFPGLFRTGHHLRQEVPELLADPHPDAHPDAGKMKHASII